MSLRAFSIWVAMGASGDASLSVMAMVVAPRSRARRMASTVRREYRGKLMPMTTSSGPTRIRLSKISLTVLVDTVITLSKIRCILKLKNVTIAAAERTPII